MMNRYDEVLDIYTKSTSRSEKICRLQELELDLLNELEAQDQNMQPELHNQLSEALMLLKNLLRALQTDSENPA